MRNLYEVLGVPKSADQATIKKAYKKLAREFHPDLNKAAGAADRFKEITAAYEVVGDEQKRSLYDEFGETSLQNGFNADAARAWKGRGMPRGGGNPFAGGSPFGGGVGMDDLFGSLFGGRGQRGPSAAEARGADIEATIEVDLVPAIRGDAQTIEFRRPTRCNACAGRGGTGRQTCSTCGGGGRVKMRQLGTFEAIVACDDCGGTGSTFAEECNDCAGTGRTMTTERLRITLPKGVRDGQTIRLRGKGGEGREPGHPGGDLLLNVQVREHAFLQREGPDLVMDVPITFGEAMVGATVPIPTPTGTVKVKVPAGAKNGQRLRLRGKGAGSASEPGDLYVVLRPTPPPTPGPDSERLATEIDQHYPTDIRADLLL